MIFKIQKHLSEKDSIVMEAWNDAGKVISTLNTDCVREAISFYQVYDYTRIVN